MQSIKIVLTGGHAATTGIAVVEEIRRRAILKDSEIYWIGSLTAIEGSKISTIESRTFPKIGVNFIPITAGKIQTKFTKHTIPSLLKIPVGFIQAFWLLLKIKPKVTLSFGGYSSFPVIFWSWVFRIPVILHEQTVVAGRASISSAFFATKIALARLESQIYFPKNKSIVTGNPLMTNVLNIKNKTVLGKPPTILVIGGSRGSNFINDLVMEMAKSILVHNILIHITGERDFEKVEKFKDRLPPNLRINYKIYSSINPSEMGNYYSRTDLVISRSGANSVSEIIYARRPAILIPLPRTFLDEQVKNAKYAESFGFSSVFLEKDATPEVVLKEINRFLKDWNQLVRKAEEHLSQDTDASKKIVDLVAEYI
ncbi:MAG: UDP-N-acetylglucosamine--N-acetylmuramyl-(pentapeptide) pyrophosphoryl-undecaprenol N-acetylglucosamine transferase [Candidatus Woesebacteria bacterium]|nr:MAG: UDP-N-acetylglucosamine--N-acetylmuramyl-(pentapeptide) pyrophosphoryl-undecaprenol N-acetylglucosamine transferase [Candidatus Woesebacteria bacterium]